MKTFEIKKALRERRIPYWRVAECMQISEMSVWRLLRTDEISEEKGTAFLTAIRRIEEAKE